MIVSLPPGLPLPCPAPVGCRGILEGSGPTGSPVGMCPLWGGTDRPSTNAWTFPTDVANNGGLLSPSRGEDAWRAAMGPRLVLHVLSNCLNLDAGSAAGLHTNGRER